MSRKRQLIEAFKALGHVPRLDDGGNIDHFVLEFGYHNGPGCTICGESFCEHCISDAADLEYAVGKCIGPEGVARRKAEAHQKRIENAVKLLRSEGFQVSPPKGQ